MNVEPLIIEPHVLTDLGAGDSAAGAKRLRLLIADARDRKPVVGPTERPQSVRIAVRSDEAALEDLLALDAAENAVAVAPFSPADVQDLIRSVTRADGAGVIGAIDDDTGTPIATVGLWPQKFWWSSVWYLEQKFIFVHPDHRVSRHAADLVHFSHWVSDAMSKSSGRTTYVVEGVTATSRVEGKIRMMSRMSNYCGGNFIYPFPGAA